jgi:hypothetical protein
VRELQQALDQRRDLLVRGRRAPSVAPSVLVRAGTPARGLPALQELAVRDAVTVEGADYVVEGAAIYFAEGQTWKLLHLAAAGADERGQWLYIGPGGLDVALLDEVASPPTQGLQHDARELRPVASGTATVDLESPAGSARGVLVSFTRYGGNESVGLVEDWPDGARHAYAGKTIHVDDLEVWPSTDGSTKY